MLQALDDLTALVWSVRRKGMEAFLMPAAALEDGVLLCRDSSLVTLIEVSGSRSMMGREELAAFVASATRRWTTLFLDPGHALHVVFERDPGAAALARVTARQRRSAAASGLELDDVLAERESRLASLVASEALHLACWTRPSALTRDQERRDRKEMRRRLKPWPARPSEAQCPLAAFESLEPRHEAFLAALTTALGDLGIVHARLSTAAALDVVRAMANARPHHGWHPATAANAGPARATDPAEAGALPLPLASQILDEDPASDGPWIVLGGRRFAAIDMVLGPRSPRPFAEFLNALAEAGIPVRFSLLLEGGAMAGLGTTAARVASAFLAFSSDESRLARDALRELALKRADSTAVVRLRLTLVTWTDAAASHAATARAASRLQQIVEGWGEIVSTRLVGDPLEAFVATVPGFACGSTAPASLAPLSEALTLLPVSRPAASPATRANHLFRAPDGRLLPFSFEDAEDYGCDLIYGIPGRGKSVLMNSLSLAWCLQGGAEELPLLAIVDIGPSSAGLVSLIREALPPHRRHEAGWFRLAMRSDHAINPFDTQLGCRRPLEAERRTIATLLEIMLTPAGAAGVPDGAREIIAPVIEAAYRMRSDLVAGGEPALYTPRRDGSVDEALELAACRLPEAATWWDVVDALFHAGMADAAGRAQRYAVPVLSDLNTAVRDPQVQALAGSAAWGTGGETVTQAFTRILAGLAETWPIFFHPTAFDTGAARIAAVDLRDVAPSGSAEAERQAAAAFLLARHALTRHWWIDEADADAIPEPYRSWHRDRFRRIRETPKRLAFDEFHRAASSPAVLAQVERDIRETRKLRVTVSLASQRVEDFGPALVELATRIWVLGSGGKRSELATLASLFGLSDTLQDVVRHALTGPKATGAPALLIASDSRGRIEQTVVNSPGPSELWALTTAPRDVALRERLQARLPPAEARALLGAAWPGGTAARRIETLLAASADGAPVSEREVLDRMAEDLMTRAALPPPAHPLEEGEHHA